MNKEVEVLNTELARRETELAEYDLNIKIYTTAITVARTRSNTEEFQGQLEKLLTDTVAQRLKSEIMLITIQELLNDCEVNRRGNNPA